MNRGTMRRGCAPLDVDKVWKLHLQGVSTADIASRMSHAPKTISTAIKVRRDSLGIEKTEAERKQVLGKHLNGLQ